jgi:eukaryotic-like serine/threonine-protein kinase
VIAGRYTLEREIGRGGAGVVHLARDEVLGRSVAIKRLGLLPGTTEDDIARAEREARLAAGVNHPHVVSILDLVKDEDCYWLVMEHVQGRTLTEVIAAEGPLAPTRAAAIIAQAASGLVEADKAGIVHRDVKPSNILIDADDHVKLGDFGIARSADDAALTRTGLVTGSPAYLAPEVASGTQATAASDVWSLGATLFHAVVGRAPYEMGQNVLGGLYKIVHDDPPRLPDDHPLAGPLAQMMVKDPEERWPAARVRDELQRIARGEASDVTRRLALEAGQVGAGTPAVLDASATPIGGSRGPRAGWVAAALVLLLLAGVGAWLVWPADGQRSGGDAAPSDSGQSQEPTASDEPSDSADPSEEPSDEPSTDPSEEPTEEPTADGVGTGTRAEMQAFVQDYFSRVTSDPEATFDLLTPQFQAQSGGYEGYSGFWSTIESATPSGIRADPATLTTEYTIEYVTTSGRTTTQQGRLQLQRSGDGYLIAGEG